MKLVIGKKYWANVTPKENWPTDLKEYAAYNQGFVKTRAANLSKVLVTLEHSYYEEDEDQTPEHHFYLFGTELKQDWGVGNIGFDLSGDEIKYVISTLGCEAFTLRRKL